METNIGIWHEKHTRPAALLEEAKVKAGGFLLINAASSSVSGLIIQLALSKDIKGLKPENMQYLICTHLDIDHAGNNEIM